MTAISHISLTIKIDSGNDAICTWPHSEIHEALKGIVRQINTHTNSLSRPIKDTNGNRIGEFDFAIKREA